MIQKQPKRLILVLAALLVTLALAGPYPLRAQDTRKNLVTLNVEQKSVADVLGMLESSTDYVFFYNTADVNKARKVSLQFKDADIQTVLQKLFEGQDNTFKIDGRQVYIIPKAKAAAKPASGNPTRLTGHVVDAKGEPLPGATIMIKGGKGGAITNEDGSFVLDGIKVGTVLVASMISMEDLEFTFTGQDGITITLRDKSEALDDAVVVAFGTQKKESVIGAITTIDPGKLKIPSSNLTTALAGNMAGIIAYQRTGEPGQDNADFFVRGITTFGANTHPLILIDNIELTATDLARLQPDDIASFSIMKDATATALYGARGANGVILVTTKRGTEGSAKVFARLETSISQPTQVVELADPVTFMKLANEAVLTRNPEGNILYSQACRCSRSCPGCRGYRHWGSSSGVPRC